MAELSEKDSQEKLPLDAKLLSEAIIELNISRRSVGLCPSDHPIYGALYLSNLQDVSKVAVIAAYEHHMRYDGSGYPEIKRRLKRQHLVSQLVAIADVFDAMRTKRSYRDTVEISNIVGFFKQRSGNDFNPALVDNFITSLRKVKAF